MNQQTKTQLAWLLIAGNFILLGIGSASGLTQRHEPRAGDPGTLFGGGLLLYWAFVFYLASRDPEGSFLYRFLTQRGSAGFVAGAFAIVGLMLVLLSLGVMG